LHRTSVNTLEWLSMIFGEERKMIFTWSGRGGSKGKVLNNGDRLMDIRLNFDFVTLKFRRCLRKGFRKFVQGELEMRWCGKLREEKMKRWGENWNKTLTIDWSFRKWIFLFPWCIWLSFRDSFMKTSMNLIQNLIKASHIC
jgi:hypothetical protein